MDKVILLHGILLPKAQLRPLANYLAKNSYQAINLGYPSTTNRLSILSENLLPKIQELIQGEQKVHFVVFSMGGLMIRELLPKLNITNPGRLVMIAPPNQGSPLAKVARKIPIVKQLYGPALLDLEDTTHINSRIHLETGVLAGIKQSFNPYALFFKENNDGKVAVSSTKLEGTLDHLTLNFTHSLAPLNRQVQKQTLYFLKYGKFLRE